MTDVIYGRSLCDLRWNVNGIKREQCSSEDETVYAEWFVWRLSAQRDPNPSAGMAEMFLLVFDCSLPWDNCSLNLVDQAVDATIWPLNSRDLGLIVRPWPWPSLPIAQTLSGMHHSAMRNCDRREVYWIVTMLQVAWHTEGWFEFELYHLRASIEFVLAYGDHAQGSRQLWGLWGGLWGTEADFLKCLCRLYPLILWLADFPALIHMASPEFERKSNPASYTQPFYLAFYHPCLPLPPTGS